MKRMLPLLCVTFLVTACQANHWSPVQTLGQHDALVFIEQQAGRGKTASGTEYRHPASFEPAQIAAVLANLEYRRPAVFNGKESEPVFTPKQTAELTPLLVQALAQAAPSQRVRFVSYNRGMVMLFPTRRMTEGIVFVDPEGRLNIAFAIINEPRDVETEDNPAVPFPQDPQTITESMISLVDADWYEPGRPAGGGGTGPLWAVIDLPKAQVLLHAKETAKAVAPQAGAEAPRNNAPFAGFAPGPAVQKEAPPTPREQLKEDLRFLKGLHDEKLITEEEYDKKRKELLDKIR